jgi:hypothetical protein
MGSVFGDNPDTLIYNINELFQRRLFYGQWGHEDDDIPQGPYNNTPPSGFLSDLLSYFILWRVGFFCFSAFYKLDTHHEPLLADFPYVWQVRKTFKLFFQQGNLTLHLFQSLLFLEEIDIFDGHTAGKGIARISMAVKKGLKGIDGTKKTTKDLICCERSRQGQVSAGDTLGNAQKIGLHVFFIAGKHVARPPEACGHFIGY